MAKSLTSRRLRARIALLVAVPFAVSLAGCSGDDVELNGKIFDAVGLNSGSAKSAEPKLAARAPLVMPPNPDRVPEPGVPPEVAASEVATLKDPDKVAKTSRVELERQQAEYCKVHYEQAKARGDNDADQASGPLGPCRGSVLSAIKTWTDTGESEE